MGANRQCTTVLINGCKPTIYKCVKPTAKTDNLQVPWMESDNLQIKNVQIDKQDSLYRKKVKRQTANLLSNICEPTIYKFSKWKPTIYCKALMNGCKPTIYHGVNKWLQIDNL
jgi:hypothetical protein